MVKRDFWITRIENAWSKRSIVWLRGVRRAGKTTLALSLPDVEYVDCEIPRLRQAMEDPESFLQRANSAGRRLALDEVHRLPNPSELLKIAADHFPRLKILATGSSTLGASSRFRDTLTGRKTELWLTPMTEADLRAFGRSDLEHRFLHGGLPPFFLSESLPEAEIQEWMDAYWAKDIQDLFRLERRISFQRFFELLLAQSGGIFEATKFAAPCEVSRSTIHNYLGVLEATGVALVLRPFSSRPSAEIISAPKVYGFDTGFVCTYRGWTNLRRDDLGRLWEHYVLNEMTANLQSTRPLHYWRDKRGHEVDFIFHPPGRKLVAIECKWSTRDFDPGNLLVFGAVYSNAELFVVSNDAHPGFSRVINGRQIDFMALTELINRLNGSAQVTSGRSGPTG